MAIRPQQVHPVPEPLVRALEALRHELNIPDDFPPAVHDAAVAAAALQHANLPDFNENWVELSEKAGTTDFAFITRKA